jgi:hypothetical protein
MKHDLAHEERQNAAIRLLALALSQVAANSGHSGHKTLVDEVEAVLAAKPEPEEMAPVAVEPEPEPVKVSTHSAHPASHKTK